MSVNMGKVVAYLDLDVSSFTKGFAKAKSELKVFGDSSATVSQNVIGLTNSMRAVGGVLSKSVTVPLATAGTVSLKFSMDFEKSMSNVKAISGATGREFDDLRQKALDLGQSTVFSATDVANAMTEMAKAGWTSQQIMSGMQGVLDATAASGEELSTVATIVADAITTFGLSASESTKVADLLSKSANAGTISVTDLGESLKYVGPIAKTMGFNIEDVVTAITAMSQAGIKGSQAGTSLRTMFARLVKPTDDVKIAMDQLGIVLTDSEGNFKSMNTILEEMRTTFQTLTPEQQTYYSAILAGQEGMSGLNALLGMSQQEYDNLSLSMKTASGTAKETAEIMQDNLAGAVEQMTGSLESAGIAIGSKLTPKVRTITGWIEDLTDRFNSLSDEEQEQIVNFGLVAAAAGPVIMVSSKLLSGATKLGKGFDIVNSEISLFIKALKSSKNGMQDEDVQTGRLYKTLTSVKGILTPMNLGIAAAGTALVALGVATYDAHKRTEEYREQLREETEEQKALTDAINKQVEAKNQSVEAIDETVNSANAEYEANTKLMEKLTQVVDENGKIVAGKETYARVIAGELSDAIGTEIGISNGQITNYQALSNEIYKTIDAKRALAIQEAMSEEYNEALAKQAEAERLYNESIYERIDLESQLAEKQSELAQIQKENADYIREHGEASYELGQKYNQAAEEVSALQDKLKDNKEELGELTETYEHWNQVVQNYEGLSAALIEGDAASIDMALLKIQESFLTAETATTESLEKQSENLKEKYDQMVKAFEQGNTNVTQEMLDQMQSLVQQSDEQLQISLDQSKQKLTTSFQNIGMEAPQAMIDAFAQKDSDIQNQVLTMLSMLQNNVQLSGEQLKTVFTTLGIDAPQSLIDQLTVLQPSVQESAINLLSQLQYGEQAKRPDVLAQLRDLGIQVDNSVAGGIDSNEQVVSDAAANVGSAGNKSMQDELGKTLKSPDVDSNTETSAARVARSARSAFENAFATQITATIRASVSGVAAGVGALASAISGSHAGGLSYVPYNGYVAELHEGERVLTKQQNREYNEGRTGQGGDTFNFYNTKPTPYEYARQMKKAKRDLALGY